ncbi:MAG TPA: hypothetical protein VFS88_04155 [Micavibrio sp.]|nr:hypothetical protein [Micavibrio sp.]
MEEIRIDNSILRDEADKFLKAIEANGTMLMDDTRSSLSKIFENQAQATDTLLNCVAGPLKPVEGGTIADVLSAQNYSILAYVKSHRGFFNHDAQGRERRRFFSLVDKIYVHGPKKMFEDDRSEREAAKRILREFAEATILYSAMVRKINYGLMLDPATVKQVVHKAHELISDNPDCVVAFPRGGRRGPGQGPK